VEDLLAEIKRLQEARYGDVLRWSGRVNGMQACLRELEERYFTLLKAVADGTAMRPRHITILNGPEQNKAQASEIERLRAEVVRLTAAHDHQYKMAGLMLREAERSAAAAAAASRAQWCGVNVEQEEDAACYRWLRANWGRLTTHTSYEGGINEPRKVREITILPGALSPVDPDSLHRAILRAMSEGEKAC
jgi:hypothetical protein